MKIIAGLGNPGENYEDTRHNAGYKAIDSLREKLEFPEFKEKKKFNALISKGEYNNDEIMLVKPLTFMNLSGRSVSKVINYYGAEMFDVWIIYDDLDFELGNYKIRQHGSGGTHNGVQSIITETGSREFPRWRIGIESREYKDKKNIPARNYVLGKFTEEESKKLKKVLKKVTDSIVYALENGVLKAMNKYNEKH
jgi:PTH1 family peptidyl-tRNA hydrolase